MPKLFPKMGNHNEHKTYPDCNHIVCSDIELVFFPHAAFFLTLIESLPNLADGVYIKFPDLVITYVHSREKISRLFRNPNRECHKNRYAKNRECDIRKI